MRVRFAILLIAIAFAPNLFATPVGNLTVGVCSLVGGIVASTTGFVDGTPPSRDDGGCVITGNGKVVTHVSDSDPDRPISFARTFLIQIHGGAPMSRSNIPSREARTGTDVDRPNAGSYSTFPSITSAQTPSAGVTGGPSAVSTSTAVPIPEPLTVTLIGAGLLGLAAFRWRQNSR
jgi:PEP-CTERM motif